MYVVVRQTAKCVFVRQVEDITEEIYSDGTGSAVNIVGVKQPYGPEYRLLVRETNGTVHFTGKANYSDAETFWLWDGKPLRRESY